MKRYSLPKRFHLDPQYADLVDEPEDVKAVRMLRGFRHWISSRRGVLCVQIDGQTIMMIKYGKQHQFPEPEAEASL